MGGFCGMWLFGGVWWFYLDFANSIYKHVPHLWVGDAMGLGFPTGCLDIMWPLQMGPGLVCDQSVPEDRPAIDPSCPYRISKPRPGLRGAFFEWLAMCKNIWGHVILHIYLYIYIYICTYIAFVSYAVSRDEIKCPIPGHRNSNNLVFRHMPRNMLLILHCARTDISTSKGSSLLLYNPVRFLALWLWFCR